MKRLNNVPGALAHVSEVLGREGLSIRAISVAYTSDISTVRFVVDDPDKDINILNTQGVTTKLTDVLAVETPDHPGGIPANLRPLKAAGINVHYLYSHLGRVSDQAVVILGVDKPKEAQKVLKQNWVQPSAKRPTTSDTKPYLYAYLRCRCRRRPRRTISTPSAAPPCRLGLHAIRLGVGDPKARRFRLGALVCT